MTNQFTDEQVEAAAMAIYVARYGEDYGWRRYSHNYLPQARAALEAAAGVAPQADGHDCTSCQDCIHNGGKCCGCYDGVCCKEAVFPAPVQPSSTVDVDKLAEVLNRDECYDIPYGRFDRYSAARAVAEWLGGEGR